MKKIITTALLVSMLSMTIMPAIAVTEKNSNSPKQFKSMVSKNKKNQKTDDYKFDYVNMSWWGNFNDDLLNEYIEKAVLNNYDLKMATINVEEYYQNVKLQFANELPSAVGGFGPGVFKAPGMTKTQSGFGLPIIVQYEADIFLKNHNKTKAVKNFFILNPPSIFSFK